MEHQRRATVDQLLKDCWAKGKLGENPNTANTGYDIESMDEWIVDNQRLIRDEKESERSGQKDEIVVGTPRTSIIVRDNATNKPAKKSAADSLFSNYFLSVHLLFSLPTFGEDDDDVYDGDDYKMLVGNTPNSISSGISPSTLKPSTYGEITTLGTRQLFGAMGLFHSNRNSIQDCHFVDLGSGAGKLVGQAVLELSDTTVQRATGIELSPSRHQAAFAAKTCLLERLQQANKTSNLPVNDIDVEAKMELIEGDLFDVDLSTATHIYVASLCFPDALMLQLEELLLQRIARQQQESEIHKESSSNLQWVATLRPFPNDLGGIRPTIRFMEMSWTSPLGSAVYLYRCDDGNEKR